MKRNAALLAVGDGSDDLIFPEKIIRGKIKKIKFVSFYFRFLPLPLLILPFLPSSNRITKPTLQPKLYRPTIFFSQD